MSLGDALYVRGPDCADLVIDGGNNRDELATYLGIYENSPGPDHRTGSGPVLGGQATDPATFAGAVAGAAASGCAGRPAPSHAAQRPRRHGRLGSDRWRLDQQRPRPPPTQLQSLGRLTGFHAYFVFVERDALWNFASACARSPIRSRHEDTASRPPHVIVPIVPERFPTRFAGMRHDASRTTRLRDTSGGTASGVARSTPLTRASPPGCRNAIGSRPRRTTPSTRSCSPTRCVTSATTGVRSPVRDPLRRHGRCEMSAWTRKGSEESCEESE